MRLPALVATGMAAAALVAACGGEPDSGGPPAERRDVSATPRPGPTLEALGALLRERLAALAAQPTPEELAVRQRLLAEIAAGTYGDCGCTAEARAEDRVRSGKVGRGA